MGKLDRDFCLSPDGKFVALVSEGGIDVRIIEINTRTVHTEFKRGASVKDIACFGFCGNWFGLASRAAAGATFHFFPIRKKNEH